MIRIYLKEILYIKLLYFKYLSKRILMLRVFWLPSALFCFQNWMHSIAELAKHRELAKHFNIPEITLSSA